MEEELQWQNIEEQVRIIAARIWGKTAVSKVVHGVQIDCFVEKHDDYYCLVEVSKNNTLDKVRTDISKLASVGYALLSEGIYCEKYIVLTNEPTNSMRTTGEGSHVKVVRIREDVV